MKKRFFRNTLCALLALTLAVSSVVFAFAGTPAEDAHLRFDASGNFRILNFSDFQGGQELKGEAKSFIRRAVYYAMPDLIVLTGDNIYGWRTVGLEQVRTAIAQFMDIFEELGVPVAIVFGNHDDDKSSLTKEKQMEIYNSYSVSISYDEGSSMSGCGTYNIPIYGSTQTDKVKFNLWMLDSGSSSSHNLTHYNEYDGVQTDQLNWYVSKSNALKTANGGNPVPSIAFQHIIVPEIYSALDVVPAGTPGAREHDGQYYALPDTAAPGSILGEAPSPTVSGRYCGEFSVMKSQGDVLAIVCGHDHRNMYEIPYQGINLICTPTAGFYNDYDYASDPEGVDPLVRGARVFDLNEASGEYTTRMINLEGSLLPEYSERHASARYVKDIAVCSARSNMHGSVDNAIAQAYSRVYMAVDAANGNGVAIWSDLNGGDTRDSTDNHCAICMGYTLTDDPSEAMRGLGLYYASAGADPTELNGVTLADGNVWYTCNSLGRFVLCTDGAVDLNAGTDGNPIYFFASYDSAAGDPITEVSVVNTGDSAISTSDYPDDHGCFIFGGYGDGDLNKSAAGDYIYALYRTDTSGVSRTEIDCSALRQTCFEAVKKLKYDASEYVSETWDLLWNEVKKTREILRDLEDDRVTAAYSQSDVNAQTHYLRVCIKALRLGLSKTMINPNGGTCNVQSIYTYIGVPIGQIPTAKRSRYVMTGWFNAPDEYGIRVDKIYGGAGTWYAHWAVDESWVAGDADLSGRCNLRDVTMIRRYLAGWNVQPDLDHADVNWDGVVNLRDVALLCRSLSGSWNVELR